MSDMKIEEDRELEDQIKETARSIAKAYKNKPVFKPSQEMLIIQSLLTLRMLKKNLDKGAIKCPFCEGDTLVWLKCGKSIEDTIKELDRLRELERMKMERL